MNDPAKIILAILLVILFAVLAAQLEAANDELEQARHEQTTQGQ